MARALIETAPVCESLPVNQLHQKVADAIGGPVTPQLVSQAIDISNSQGHIIHGIKRNCYYPEVDTYGILPLTPEGGYASYWTGGENMFGRVTSSGNLKTIDTSFFDYAHSFDPNGGVYMTLALTSKEILSNIKNIDVPQNAYLNLNFPVPRSHMAVLRVEVIRSEMHDSREMGRIAEQALFGLMLESLLQGYAPGSKQILRIQ